MAPFASVTDAVACGGWGLRESAWCQALASSRLLVMLRPHKKFTKRCRTWLGLSKYQFLWLTFGKGVVIGYLLALLVHR